MKLCLTLIFIALSCCLAAHHDPIEGTASSNGNGGFGYLLLVPGDFRPGETIEAFIEANVTEPFTASLRFINWDEDRIFSSRQLITGGSGRIPITVPKFNDHWSGKLNFTAELEGTKEQYHGITENLFIWYQKPRRATFIETDKPIYKPGQEVKFRIVTINPAFRPEISNISKIYVESPKQIRLVQWNDVERPDGLVDLAFQLIKEPILGEYNIKAYIDGDWESQTFKVDEYVLPKFEVTFSAPKYVLINAEEYSFQVCAKYTYGQPVRGSVSGQVGLERKSYYGQYGYFQYYPEGREQPSMNPIDFAGVLDQDGCLDVDVNITGMRQNSPAVSYRHLTFKIQATAYEANTGNEFSETYEGTELESKRLNFELESPASFKPGIPYQGRIKVRYPDELPVAGEEIIIEVFDARRCSILEGGFIQDTTDASGIVSFEIPSALYNDSVRLHVRSADYKPSNYTGGCEKFYDGISYFWLDPVYSPTGRYIQIQPIYDTLSVGDTPEVRVRYTSNDSSVSSLFRFQFVARNQLHQAIATAAGQDRMKRNSDPEEPIELGPDELGPPDTFISCPEGFEFGDGVKKCVRISAPVPTESECERQAREADEKGGIGNFRPNCEENGDFSAQQCHSSTNYCWCVDENGQEIKNTKTGPTEERVDCMSLFEETVPTTPSEGPSEESVSPTPYNEPDIPTLPPKLIHYDPQELQEAVFTVKITASMSPVARLVVHYLSPEGEVVADSVELKINEFFENEVSLDFSDEEVLPGGETTLKVSAEPGSLCGIGIVDKSVYVLGGENKLTPKKLFSEFNFYGVGGDRSRCWRGRKKRSPVPDRYYGSVSYQDSGDAFEDAGLLVISNYGISVAPCSPIIVAHSTEDARGIQKSEEKIRSYFPSTWLWTLQRVSENFAEMDLSVPHTITDWVANGFCTNVERGVGVAPTVYLRAFQPFFLSMSLPYSIILTEKTPIKVSVFNYLKECLVVEVTLAESEDFTLSGNTVYTVAVPAGESVVVSYKVTATQFGEIPIQISAVSVYDDSGLCGSEPVGAAGIRDAVLRNLLVKPEGEPETTTKSDYFCLQEGDEPYTKQVFLDVPKNHVPETAEGGVTVTGDLVGNTLSNVEDLIRMPYGCGEQNILSMVPNIVALQYLQSIGESTPEIEEQAKRYILSGYQRELKYRRDDGSYSAFGNSNPEGSTFLTAFVIRTYAHANKFVGVDESDMNVTIDWLRGIQEKDGSFRTVGYLAHKAMKGGVNNNVTLAAYVVSTFLEAGYTVEDPAVSLAFNYLNSQLDSLTDTYSAALLAYAYALADMDEFDTVYEILQDMAIEEEGTIHWESNRVGLPSYAIYYRDSSKAQNIEMTAYVLRAIMIKDIPDALLISSGIARWLVAQRNPRGGFSSTQDTVIGMTALAEFSMRGSGDDTQVTVTMDFSGAEQLEFDVNNGNRYVVQRNSFENFPADVSISASGRGCILYSISGDYYIKKEKQTLNPFTLFINAVPAIELTRKRREATEGSESCDVFTISIGARYNGEDGGSNMAIINFRPVSGFVFDQTSLDSLEEKYKFLKRYEINADTITFYFDEITNEDIMFDFDVTKEFDVEDPKPAFITILDYYENGLKVAEEFEFVCARAGPQDIAESTTYTTPVSPSGFQSSTPTETPDFDECSVDGICGGPEYECINFPGTYECRCAEGYVLDDNEVNCIVESVSCPVCPEALPENVEEKICSSDFIHTMKLRRDGRLRALYNFVTEEKYENDDRVYYDVNKDETCSCDHLAVDERVILITTDVPRDTEILLDETVLVVPLTLKRDVTSILSNC